MKLATFPNRLEECRVAIRAIRRERERRQEDERLNFADELRNWVTRERLREALCQQK